MEAQGKLDEKLINSLQAQLKEKEEMLTKSATYGKELLYERTELQDKLEICTSKLDELMQSNHNLKTTYSNDVQCLRNEIDMLTEQLKNQHKSDEHETEKLAVINKQKVEELEKEIGELKVELDVKCEEVTSLKNQILSSQSQDEKNYQEKIIQLEQVLQEMEEANSYSINEKKQLKKDLYEKEQLLEDANDCARNLQQTIESLQNQLAEKNMQAASTYESLKIAHSEISDLKVEMQLARTTTTAEVDLDKRGNSLFSEVEDRRVKIENLVLQLKSKCKELAQELEEKHKKYDIMRMELSALQLISSRKVSPAIVEQLESELDKAQKEIKLLLAIQAAVPVPQSPSNMQGNVSIDTSQDPEYRCLRLLLHQSKSRIEELEKEIHDMWSERIIGRQQRKDHRRKIISLEQEVESLKAERLQMKSLNDSLTVMADRKENLSSEDLIGGSNSTALKITHNYSRSTQNTGNTNILKPKKTVQECKTQ